MRLFLLAVLTGVLTGCSKGDDLKSAALKVQVHYEGFRPGCVTLTVTDQAEVSRTVTTNVNVSAGPPPGTLSVAVFRQAGWSNEVKLQARAQERSCEGNQVASAETTASLAKDGITAVELSLSAVDGDGDGFVSSAGGTDCNDRDETVGGPIPWYTDSDGDGYGNRQLPAKEPACDAPSYNSARRTGDCNDQDPSVHPDQAEFRCDGKDDNCDDVADEVFVLNAPCDAAFQCPGVTACDTPTGEVTCKGTREPTAYYLDEDGDGEGTTGTDGGVTCGDKPAGTATMPTDCDESSVYVAAGKTEVCDRLDNNCDGRVDEGAVPCNLKWEGSDGGTNQPRWNAVAVGQNVAWIAGPASSDNVVQLNTDRTTTRYTCAGNWKAAWVSDTGELFLADAAGKLARKTAAPGNCTSTSVPGLGVELLGIVGFNSTSSNPLTLYTVSSSGLVFKWTPPDAPVQFATTSINLRAVTGTAANAPIIAVGAKDYLLPKPQPQVLSINPADGKWEPETLPSSVKDIYLTGVSAVNANYVYVVGDNGVVLERNHGAWKQLPTVPSKPNLTDVLAFGKNAVYVTTETGAVQFFNGVDWTAVYTNTPVLRAIDGNMPTRLGAVGDDGVAQFFYRP
ncbi:putative metal-binding motif-containing protein [Corallococcus interemptor]|nr:putative metal-binding motif-containing protein [Corallococcus interemptor]